MKRTLLIAFLLGIFLHSFPQKQNSTDEVSILKIQLSSLRQTNAKLTQDITDLKKITQSLQDSLASALNNYNARLNALQDSIRMNMVIANAVKSHSGIIDHSLKTRKMIFYIACGLAIIVIIASYLLVMKMFRTNRENVEIRVANTRDSIEMTIHRANNDLQSQIAATKTEIVSAKEEFDKKIQAIKK